MPRFMLLMQPTAGDDRTYPPPAATAAFDAQLASAGALLACDDLQPLADGVRVSFSGGGSTVLDGPFEEPREVGGYWVIQARTLEEAVEWARRAPAGEGDRIEVRRVQEPSAGG